MSLLSVVIITWNEEKNIERCIRSVQGLADEVVVVDSFSTDRTPELCMALGVRFEQHAFEGYIEQKNYALSRCSYNWVLALDADETLSLALHQSILAEKQKGFAADGYTMNRLTNYMGKWVRHSGWYPDRKLRLFDRTKARWGGLNPHDKVVFDQNATIAHIQGDLLHYSYTKPEDHSFQIEHFSSIGAQAYFQDGRNAGLFTLWFSPVVKFVRDYFIKLGFMDGKTGWQIARFSALATWLKYLKLRYLHNAIEPTNIIISRTDSIGDVMLTLPMCGLIRKSYPEAKIIFLAKSYTMPIVRNCEHVHSVLDAEDLANMRFDEQVKLLRETNADTIIHVFPDRHIARLAKKAGIPHRIGTSGRLWHWLYANHRLPMSRKRSNLHEAQLNMKLLMPLGIVDFIPLPRIWPLNGFKPPLHAHHKLFDLVKPDKINLIFHPKSKGSAREWPLERFSELAHLLPADKFRVFIGGTATEGELMKPLLDSNPEMIDITGQLTLDQYISFIAIADGLIAASTGPLHIAASLGRIAVGVYPSMRPIHPGRWKPLGPWAVALTLKENCNACKKSATCDCLTNLDAGIVANQLNKLIDERKRQMAGSG
jgi:ADP-heptose:LPS heptosyltransferase